MVAFAILGIAAKALGILIALGIAVPALVVSINESDADCDNPLETFLMVSAVMYFICAFLSAIGVGSSIIETCIDEKSYPCRFFNFIIGFLSCFLGLFIISWTITGSVWRFSESTDCPDALLDMSLAVLIFSYVNIGIAVIAAVVGCIIGVILTIMKSARF